MKAASVVLSIAGAAVVMACTAGTGTGSAPVPIARDVPPNTRDPVNAGPENPGARRDPPPGDRQGDTNNPQPVGGAGGGTGGGAGGGGEGTPSTCPACDTTYTCTVIDPTTGPGTQKIKLKAKDGECSFEGDATFSCDGTITGQDAEGNVVTLRWVPFGEGGFAITGTQGTATCLPSTDDGSSTDDDGGTSIPAPGGGDTDAG